MKTRGKVKGDTWNVDYAKEGADGRDLLDDGAEVNGYSEEKTDDGIPARGEVRSGRGGGNKRPGRMPRVGGPKGRSDKNSVDPAEFKDVVQGFFEFIEELNKAGRKKPDKRKVPNEIKTVRQAEEPNKRKLVKFDTEPTQVQSSEKFELQPDALAAGSKTDKNPLYRQTPPKLTSSNAARYKEEDLNTGKELLNLLKDQAKEPANLFPGNLVQAQAQEAKAQRETENARREAQPMMDFGSKYQHLQQFPGGNVQSYTNPLLMKQQPTKQQQQQQQAANLYGGFDFPNNPMYADAIQRLRLQQQQAFDKNPMSNYFMPPYDNYQKMFHNDLLNLQLMELLQKPMGSVPPHGAAALFENLSREFSVMNPMEMPGQQRYPNQSVGMELMREGSNVMNPKSLEGKLGRAATHVAIAYFIYFKSLDSETISKTDKTKIDPTYNARMLKEKKHDAYPSDSLETYLAQNLAKMNNNPFDYLGNAGIQRLMAQGNPDQLRELQLQRMQQEALLRNEELMQLRNAAYQGQAATKNEAKMEEEVLKRRQEETRGRPQQQQQVKTQPKEEEIIEIKENSEGEQEVSQPPQKVEQKRIPIDQSELQKGKTEDNPISAEDIVEEITELTGLGQDKKGVQSRKNTSNTNNSASPAPASKPKEAGEASKPEVQETSAQNPANAEAVATQIGSTEKESAQPDQAKSSQVVSTNEAPDQEAAQKESSKPAESPQKDEKQ